MTVGERIKMKRKALGLSADQLAERVGVNRATIYRYESDEIRNMGTETLVPLAAVLRTTPGWLLVGDDQEESFIQESEHIRDEYNSLMDTASKATADQLKQTEAFLKYLMKTDE